MNAIGLRSPGEEVAITYVRDGQTRTASATLGQRIAVSSAGADINPGLAGAEFAANTATSRGGVEVAAVAPDSPAAQRGLRDGDVIVAVNRTAVSSISDLIREASNEEILFLLVIRGDRQLMLQIR
jgi:S1-C subfamily serine protease